MGIESDGILSWPGAGTSGDSPDDAVGALIETCRELAETRREVHDLRERVAELQAENERLAAVATRGRGDAVHSTLPLRAVGVSDIAQLFGRRTPGK